MQGFRDQQRRTVLSDFKALYKSRNVSSHKAQLRHKYRRVKELSSSSLLENLYNSDQSNAIETDQESYESLHTEDGLEPGHTTNDSDEGQRAIRPMFVDPWSRR